MQKYQLPHHLTFNNIKVVYQEVVALIHQGDALEISFDYIDTPNTLCSAFILACIKVSKAHHKKIFFVHVPKGVFVLLEHQDLIRVVEGYCS